MGDSDSLSFSDGEEVQEGMTLTHRKKHPNLIREKLLLCLRNGHRDRRRFDRRHST